MLKNVIVALLAVSTVAGASEAQGARPEKAKKAYDPNKKVCRRADNTGSIMPASICHTPAEWASIDKQQGIDTQSVLDQRNSNPGALSPTR